jgi:hypothetical protein
MFCFRDAARVRCQATGKRGRRRTRAPGSKDPPSENAVLALASVADVRRVACRGALEGLHARLVPGRAVDAVSGVVGGGRSSASAPRRSRASVSSRLSAVSRPSRSMELEE